MSQYQDGIKLKTTTPSVALLKLLRKWYPNQSLMEDLKRALRAWNPWAEELLDFYIAGAKRSCTSVLCKKYQLSDRAVRKRNAAFENFILDFLKK